MKRKPEDQIFHRESRGKVSMSLTLDPAVKRAFLRRYKRSCWKNPSVMVQALMVLFLESNRGSLLIDAGHYSPSENRVARRARRREGMETIARWQKLVAEKTGTGSRGGDL